MGDFLTKNRTHILFLMVAVAAFLVIKYMFPLLVPFILAVLIVAAIYPVIQRIHVCTHIGQGFLAGLFLLLIFSVMGVVLWLFCSYGIHWLGDKLKCIDDYKQQFCGIIKLCSGKIEKSMGMKSGQIENIVLERVNILIEDMEVNIVPGIMDQSVEYLKMGIGIVSFFVVMIIAAILIIKDFEVMREKMMEFSIYQDLVHMFQKMCRLILSFFRAQVIIMILVGAICIAGLYFAGNKAYWILGAVTGLLDVLPFVGTGITLLPYMFWKYLNEEYVQGTILLVTFLLSASARELLEPKLIGKKMNVLPILILISVYAGVQVFGTTGVFLGPIYMMILSEAADRIYCFRET